MMQIVQNPTAAGGSLLDIFTDNPIVVAGLLFLAAVPFILNFFNGELFHSLFSNFQAAVFRLAFLRQREEITPWWLMQYDSACFQRLSSRKDNYRWRIGSEEGECCWSHGGSHL